MRQKDQEFGDILDYIVKSAWVTREPHLKEKKNIYEAGEGRERKEGRKEKRRMKDLGLGGEPLSTVTPDSLTNIFLSSCSTGLALSREACSHWEILNDLWNWKLKLNLGHFGLFMTLNQQTKNGVMVLLETIHLH